MLCKYQIQRDEAVPVKVAAFLSRNGLLSSSTPLDLVVAVPQSARWFQRELADLQFSDRISKKKLCQRQSWVVIAERASDLVSTPDCDRSPHHNTMHRELALCQLGEDGSLAGRVEIDAGWMKRRRLG